MLSLHAGWRITHRAAYLAAALAVAATGGRSACAFEEWHNFVDYTKLKNALGSTPIPTGAGVSVSQVEALTSNATPGGPQAYWPDPTHADFATVTVIDGTGSISTGSSQHATGVGARIYGDNSSVAPGVTAVTMYEAGHWLSNVLLVDQSPGDSSYPGPPIDNHFRVQNHSWVGTYAPSNAPPWTEDPHNVDALRRYDYLIDTANGGKGMTAVVGLNNGASPMPYLLSHSYNAIAVGRSDGIHSAGLTLDFDGVGSNDTYGPGRSKPDIVGPRPASNLGYTSSVATAMVSSTAAMLHQAAAGTDAANSEVIKAMLMAGATKNEFPGWTRMPNGPSDYSRPLDDTYGAGELNVYNSYLINLGGQRPGVQGTPAAAAGAYGWDYQDFKGQAGVGDVSYKFTVPAGSKAIEFSVVLAWNVKITDADNDPLDADFNPSQSLNNLDLKLFNSASALVDQSISSVDNVEHIYRTNLGPGDYTLKVTGAANWDYGLAWRMNTLFDVVNADFNENGVIDGGDFLIWQMNSGKLLGALHTDGDADGDQDVDDFDLAAFNANSIMPPAAPAAAPRFAFTATAIPEPSTCAAALLGAGLLTWRVRASRRRHSA